MACCISSVLYSMCVIDMAPVSSSISESEPESEGDSGMSASLAPASLMMDDDAAFH